VEGTKITSMQDFAKAINGAKDQDKITIKVRDRSGQVTTWVVGSRESPFAGPKTPPKSEKKEEKKDTKKTPTDDE
jgi:hypothetical protein